MVGTVVAVEPRVIDIRVSIIGVPIGRFVVPGGRMANRGRCIMVVGHGAGHGELAGPSPLGGCQRQGSLPWEIRDFFVFGASCHCLPVVM